MNQIICPYCCKRFMADAIDFRLTGPDEETDEKTLVVDNDDENTEEISISRSKKRSSVQKGSANNDGMEIDKLLFEYYREFGAITDEEYAEKHSRQYPAISFDKMNPNISYDPHELNSYGFVNSIIYKGKKLTERLCPYCHNPLVEGAGKYNMYMISVIGNTSAGKSVYIAVLKKMIEQDSNFKAVMTFMGNKSDEDYYLGNYDGLNTVGKKLAATDGKVPPITFELEFRNILTQQPKRIMLVFRDIPGEKLNDMTTLRQWGQHIRESSALIYLVDPSSFKQVCSTTGEEYKGNLADTFSVVDRFLSAGKYEDRSHIPTAIVVAKSDIISNMAFFSRPGMSSLVKNESWQNRYPGFVSRKMVNDTSMGIVDFLNEIGEEMYDRRAQHAFANYKFFMCSSLGSELTVEDDAKWSNIRPFAVTEPLYWILSELGEIPCQRVRRYRNTRSGEERELILLYSGLDSEAQINRSFEQMKIKKGMKDSIFSGKWQLIFDEG